MTTNSIGYSPNARLLSGLTGKGDVGAFAKGRAMAGAAGLNMDRAQKDQQLATEQMQQDSQQRVLNNQNQTRQASNMTREWIERNDMASRGRVMDIGMHYESAANRMRQQSQLQQLLLGTVARMF